MADAFADDMMSSRAIYPSRFLPYMAMLAASKFFRSIGLFLSYDLLKLLHVVQFLFLMKSGSTVILLLLQKPFSSGKRLNKRQWFRIGRHAFFGSILNLLWLFGLTQCGPLRTLLLFEHSDLVVIAGASALFTHNGGGPAKFRGAVFFLIAVTGLLLFDHDDYAASHHENGESHHHHSIFTHLFNHLTSWTGLSDHKGGVVLLFFTLCTQVGYNSAAKKLSVDVGGTKRLHALSTLASAFLLMPWASFIYLTRESQVQSWTSIVFPLFVVLITVLIVDYYVEAVCVNRTDATSTARIGSMAAFVSALVLSCLWNHPYATQITNMHNVKEIISEDHVLSGGVIFSFILFMFATHILTSPSKTAKGSFIGYSAAGMPLYSFSGELLHRTSQSILLIAKNGLRQILEETDSRRIFYFLCINLGFTFVELIWGAWTNSLGLIGDGFHMLFDCSALVMGLYAAIMSKWKPTRIFSYGYDRIEVLSGFINGLFLVVISFFVFAAAVSRLADPPEIKTDRLLTVSVAGLCVNLVGIFAFSHAHSHGGGGGGGHGHSHGGGGHGHSHGNHGHSHGNHGHSHGNHGHSHGGHSHSQGCHSNEAAHNTNMQGVFLHVLADTMGSVGVIISTILIETFGWNIADPITSVFIALLIFMSVLPLLKETCLILLLRTPVENQKELGLGLQRVLSIEGVTSYRNEHFWQHSSKVVGGMLNVQVSPHASEQKIISQVTSIFKDIGVNNLTVQVEKETFFQHMSGLGVNTQQMIDMTRDFKASTYGNTSNFIKSI